MTSRHVNSITGRLSLRSPQRRSLEILDRVMEIAQPHKGSDLKSALDIIRSEFPSVEDFEHAFPSLCFALATGVGKTRLMGAFITYLHLEDGNVTPYLTGTTDPTPFVVAVAGKARRRANRLEKTKMGPPLQKRLILLLMERRYRHAHQDAGQEASPGE